MSLEDDIARVAALRGKPANYYTARAKEQPLSPALLAEVFRMPERGQASDFRAYDRLPAAARRYVSESAMPINAEMFMTLLMNANGDLERLEDAMGPLHAAKTKAWLLRHYGRDHPNLRKYR